MLLIIKKRRLKVLFPVTRLGARQEITDVTKELDIEGAKVRKN
jgi:hypothetical protein